MKHSETAHCRLCADLKPFSKLINLETDENRRRKVMEKLFRLSLEISNLNSSDDSLPKTICFPCIDFLDTAFNFVIKVETAQRDLSALIADHNLKQEICDDDHNCHSFEATYNISVVKEEIETANKVEVTNKCMKNESENQTEDRNGYIDTIVLSQIKLSWQEYNWLCAYCDTMFTSIDELKQHSIQYHTCCNPYRCIDCNIRKLNLDSFIKHVKRHRQYLKLSCYKCYLTFPRQRDTIQHEKQHISSEFKCSGCNESFATIQQSIEHSNSFNKDKKLRSVPMEHLTKDLTCVFCLKKFKHKGGLTQHLLIHTDRKRDHTCEICGKCFLNKSNLAGHMMMHNGSRPHQCEICKNQFRTVTQLRLHIGIHEGKKPFSCEQCGRLFRLKSQLSSHSIIHTDSLPYVCLYCHKGFRFKSILNQHVRQHTGLRPYECQICHRNFTNWPNYNKHMKRRHNMNMAKRKHTPEGLLPINPTTGRVDIEPETLRTAEWKKKILHSSNRPGRPKSDSHDKKNMNG